MIDRTTSEALVWSQLKTGLDNLEVSTMRFTSKSINPVKTEPTGTTEGLERARKELREAVNRLQRG